MEMKINLYFFVLKVSIESNSLRRKIEKEYADFGLIPAIKLHRQITGSSLKEAKEYVDLLR